MNRYLIGQQDISTPISGSKEKELCEQLIESIDLLDKVFPTNLNNHKLIDETISRYNFPFFGVEMSHRALAGPDPEFWRISPLQFAEVTKSPIEFDVKRFSYPPDWLLPEIGLGRCNLPHQAILYASNTGLTAYYEMASMWDLDPPQIRTYSISKWKPLKNLWLILAADLEVIKGISNLNSNYQRYIDWDVGFDLKNLISKWMSLLGKIFSHEGREVYYLSSIISNKVILSNTASGMVYPSVRLRSKIGHNGRPLETGVNYAISPEWFRINENVRIVRCSLTGHPFFPGDRKETTQMIKVWEEPPHNQFLTTSIIFS